MSNFTPLAKFETDFEGDHITMSLQRLKRKDMMNISKHVNVDSETGETSGGMSVEDIMEMSGDMVPRYVQDFQGLVDADGNHVDIKTAVNEAYFVELISAIVQEIFAISNMGKDQEKNFDKQPKMSIVAQEISDSKKLPDTPPSSG